MENALTKNYYSSNAIEYIDSTISVDMSEHYEKFLKYLPTKGKILDVGFGSARDMLYFNSLGYDTFGIDNVPEFVERAKAQGLKVDKIDFNEMKFQKEFDGIWACASLLHSPTLELAIANVSNALKDDGIAYISMKEGKGTNNDNGRFFRYVTDTELTEICKNTGLEILEIYKTSDKLKRNTIWINAIFRKCLRKEK